MKGMGHRGVLRCHSWAGHRAEWHKVACWIPDEVPSIFFDPILSATPWPRGWVSLWHKWVSEVSPCGKWLQRPARKADNIATFFKFWELQTPTAVRDVSWPVQGLLLHMGNDSLLWALKWSNSKGSVSEWISLYFIRISVLPLQVTKCHVGGVDIHNLGTKKRVVKFRPTYFVQEKAHLLYMNRSRSRHFGESEIEPTFLVV